MIKYYGNQIWNNSTRNSDKQIIYIPATQLQTVINSLDAVGLNYYAYIRSEDKNARLAINKNDLELFKRIDTQERYSEAPRFDREVKAIIGNTAYRDIKNKSYVSYNTDFALKLAEMFTRQGVPFSGRIRRTSDDNSLTTLTFDERHRNQAELLASQLKAQRAMLNSSEKLYISGNTNINTLSDVKGKWLVMSVNEFKAVESNLIGNSISYSAVANGKGVMVYYSAVDESRVLDAVSQNNIREISAKLNSILTTLSLRSSEQLEALQPAAELFLEKYDDETFVDVFSETFADTSSFSLDQLNEIARKFADEYKYFSGLELLLVPSDIPALKEKFNKEAMLRELTSERGYTEQQIAEIKKLIDNNVSQSILELIDYTFSPEQIGRVGTAQSYSDILAVVAEVKHTSPHNIGNYIRLGTYMRETPLDDKDGSDFMSETRPTITCEWSEHPDFEDGKTYSVSEFDRIMKIADSEWCENRQKEIDTYGDIDKIFEAYEKGEIDGVHQGYAKTKFTVNMPDGRKFTERQDIGDGDGGVIDFLKRTPHHSEIVKLLQADIESESHNTEADSELTDTAHQDKVSSADNRSYSATMQNYFKIKEENPDKIVLLRVGDFYEAMSNDAIVVSQTLDLHMTKRRLNDNERIDMCGFPVHSFEQYKKRLLSAGHSIEILDEVRESVERKINVTETVKLAPNTTPIGNDDYYFHRPDVGEFEAVYYNPDATAGGQFVFMHLPYELISEAKDNSTGANEFYEYLDEHAKTDIVDLDTPEYYEVLKDYAEPHPDLIGRSEDTMNSLVSESAYELNKLQNSGKNEVIDNIRAEDNEPFFEEHIIVPNKEKYSITERADSDYRYDVKQLISVDGGNSFYYAGNGKFCKTLEEARDFVKSKLSEKIVDDLKVGDLVRIDDSVWKITKIDGDFSIYLENTDKSANEQVRSHLGHWKKHLIESGFEYVTTQNLSDVTEKSDTALQTEQQADDIAFADKTFAEQVDATINGTMPFYSSLKVCDTPQILIDLGCRQLPMLYTQRHLLDALHKKSKKNPHWHGLSVEQIKKMPALLQEPAIVFDSLTRDDSVMLVLPETDNDNLPLIVSVKPNGQGRYNLEQVDSNFITSIYGKDKFAKYLETIIKNEKLLFIDKAKSQNLFERWGLQLPELTKGFDFDIIIHQSSNIVNERISEDREKSQNLFERWGEQYSELTKGSDSDIIMHQSSNIVNEKLSEDREKSQALFSVPGLQLSKGLNNLDSDIIMHQNSNIVNERLSENAEKASELAENVLQENEIESAPGSINNLFELAEQSPDKPQEQISSIDEYVPDSYNDDTNFVITDDNTVSGAKTKFRNNINAIKALKALEMNGKATTNADKKALALYTGWGGLAPAFSENPTWKNEAQELRDLLTADEYVSARASTLDAFYTDNTIIDGIYQVLRKFGFTGGDVLEPAMGIGNFFGRMPSDISRSSRLYGVEKDSVSGRIASKLYPDANITVDGFENTQFQNGSFDVAVGNIPFGDFSVNDKEYNSQHLKIHDYFFLKTLDKVRPGGIVAFVTSKGTLDKKDTSFRKSLAERADLLGAVRLPNNAFKSAGTEVTSDIIFLQKRTAPPEKLPEWVHLGATSDGLSVNQYFASHPDMVLGKIVQGNKMYGRNDDTMCIPFDDADLSRLLPEAINKISGSYTPDFDKPSPLQDIKNQNVVLPENIRQESYFVHNGELYFWGVAGRDVEITHARELWSNYSTKNAYKKYNNKNIERTKAFVELREIVRELLEVQKLPGDYGQKISELQKALNEKYDAFYSKFGLLHAQQNRLLLSRDSAYPLLLSLEAEVDKGKLVRKSDIFTERTISPPIAVEHVDTALEALNVSIVSLGEIDLDYMSELCDIPKRVIIEQLRGQIYPVPELSTDDNIVYQTASEYLSGDIYKKLDTAKVAAEANPLFEDNIPALKEAIPTPLKSGDIDVNIGATWIEPKYYQQFIYEVFQTPNEYRADIKPRFPWQRVGKKIEVEYSIYSNKWQITNKSLDKSVTVTKQLGTQFKSAYSIFESVLNLNDPRVYKDAVDKNGKIIFDKSGNPVRVLDVERTKLLQQKANIIKRKFKDWIFKDPKRRSELVAKYNREFNCIKPREFDGSHLTFPGMNSSIELRSHQKNAIAHAIFGGNTLFAHSVGAGKTFEMIATAMECKRLGFCHKSLFAVPNHLTEQIGADFLKLYPGANILVATAKDFTKANRKQLMSKIATGNYDAVIIGHSQLKNLPLSPEIQKKIYKEQIDDIIAGIAELKESNGSSFQVKAMERTRKSLQSKLDSLDTQNRDNTVYFDELGIDKLFVDEAHEFKSLFSATKLQNISGISSRASQRATDLFAKCRYLDEKTGGKGVVFATGTPVSNSITEMHTMMRYLQYDFLASHNNMQNFDNWVSTFGKIKVDYELAPAGNKFKERSRVAEYSNMPELMSMFKQVADIRPADTLHLAVPECSLHIVNTKPTELQQSLVSELSARADDVNAGKVDPSVDNMLKITGDGRKVGLDPRLINPDFEDNPETKLNRCVANVLDIYNETAPSKLTQLIFCDLGVPKKDNSLSDSDSADDTLSVSEMDSLEESGAFSVYQDIKDKLIASGVPEKEIAFIHDAHTEAQKAELFYKVRNGDVRILLGSTAKMGTGTNVQKRLVALHDLDVPWRPSDLEQRRGRMVRQGNINKRVDLYRYVTEGTFDAYSYQLLEKKQRFIGQIMTSKTPARRCSDIDQEALSYSEIKALCTGDERIKEKLTLENRVKELEVYRKDYINNKYELEDKIAAYPAESEKIKTKIEHIRQDIEALKNVPRDKDKSIVFSIKIGEKTYSERADAAKALAVACKCVKGDSNRGKTFRIGEMYGFPIELKLDKFWDSISATLVGNERYTVTFSDTMLGNLRKLENGLAHLPKLLEEEKFELNKLDFDFESAQELLKKPFEFEDEYQEKTLRLDRVTEELNAEARELIKNGVPKERTNLFGKKSILAQNKSASKDTQNKRLNNSKKNEGYSL